MPVEVSCFTIVPGLYREPPRYENHGELTSWSRPYPGERHLPHEGAQETPTVAHIDRLTFFILVMDLTIAIAAAPMGVRALIVTNSMPRGDPIDDFRHAEGFRLDPVGYPESPKSRLEFRE
ncbi:MAG: hypothetical protein ACP5XB_09855 [Isosphaeraceae bacterium]